LAQPKAGYSIDFPAGAAPHDVVFTDRSTGTIDTHSWDFGDGTTSSALSPSHTYTSPGSYTVTLTVTGPGGSDKDTRTDAVTVIASPPVASFSASGTSGTSPLLVTFTDTSTGDVDNVEWDFGDSQWSTAPTAVLHTYGVAGTYSVSLTVTGPGGFATEMKTDLVTVVASAPSAAFNSHLTTGNAPLIVDFTNASSGEIGAYTWDFGDGGASTEVNPTHTYVEAGLYSVTLTVSGPGGSDTLIKADHVQVTADELPFEIGEVMLDYQWVRIDFEREFTDPIVIARPIGSNGSDPAVVRIDSVDNEGFSVRIQEWEYLDDSHATETVGYLVVERGVHQLPDGHWIEAGSIEADHNFVARTFAAPFAKAPVVITAVTTMNEADTVTTRVHNIDVYAFEVRLQEEEANDEEHLAETIAYIAWEPSSGEVAGMSFEVARVDDAVTDSVYTIGFSTPFELAPVFLADMQTTDGPDTANLRWSNKVAASVEIWIDEETSADSETSHMEEEIGIMVFGP
jgi:PKD repeat protein